MTPPSPSDGSRRHLKIISGFLMISVRKHITATLASVQMSAWFCFSTAFVNNSNWYFCSSVTFGMSFASICPKLKMIFSSSLLMIVDVENSIVSILTVQFANLMILLSNDLFLLQFVVNVANTHSDFVPLPPVLGKCSFLHGGGPSHSPAVHY